MLTNLAKETALNNVSTDLLKRLSHSHNEGHNTLGSDLENSDDALSDLTQNIKALEEASQRLRFMMREVSYLVRKH